MTTSILDDLISRRLRATDYRQWRAQVEATGGCAAPIHLRGSSQTHGDQRLVARAPRPPRRRGTRTRRRHRRTTARNPTHDDRQEGSMTTTDMTRPVRLVLTVEEAAECLGIGRTLMYALITAGEVESVRIGRLRRVPADALERYVSTLRRWPPDQGGV